MIAVKYTDQDDEARLNHVKRFVYENQASRFKCAAVSYKEVAEDCLCEDFDVIIDRKKGRLRSYRLRHESEDIDVRITQDGNMLDRVYVMYYGDDSTNDPVLKDVLANLSDLKRRGLVRILDE